MNAPPGTNAAARRGNRPATDAEAVGRLAAETAGEVRGVHHVRTASVRLDDRSVGIDLRLVTRYGRSVPAVAESVRAAVADRVAATTGLVVASVTVTVADVLVPGVDPAPG